MIYAFGTVDEVIAADLPRTKLPKGRLPDSCYLYLILADKWRAKIGATTHPNYRIKDSSNYFRWKTQQIFLVGPLDEWRRIETTLCESLHDWVYRRSPYCGSSERFRLNERLYAGLRQCFIAGCTDEAVGEFVDLVPTKEKYHSMKTVIGTCSICHGQVCVPHIWMGVNPPVPQCAQCGAVAATHGPVIPMKPLTQPHDTTKMWNLTGKAPEVEMPA